MFGRKRGTKIVKNDLWIPRLVAGVFAVAVLFVVLAMVLSGNTLEQRAMALLPGTLLGIPVLLMNIAMWRCKTLYW